MNVVEIFYTINLTCEQIHISEFLRSVGIYVYETSMDFEGWREKSARTGITKRLFLLKDFSELKAIKELDTENAVYIAYEEESIPLFLLKGRLLLKTQIQELLEELAGPDDQAFVKWFYPYYQKYDLQRYIYGVKNMPVKSKLLTETEKQFRSAVDFLGKISEDSCPVHGFVRAYFCMLLNKAAAINGKAMPHGFDEVVQDCNTFPHAQADAFCELKGDIYFNLSKNYIFGLLYYNKCKNDYNYTAPLKVADYWVSKMPDKNKENRYLFRVCDVNRERVDAAVRLGRQEEAENRKEDATRIYQSVIAGLKKKEEINFLFPWEFFSICTAHKRMGCMIYKDEQKPDFDAAIKEYKKIFSLWNRCGENKFINCFDEKFQPDIVDHYRSLFDIRSTIASLGKIYKLMGNNGKSELCNKLFSARYEKLRLLPVDEM